MTTLHSLADFYDCADLVSTPIQHRLSEDRQKWLQRCTALDGPDPVITMNLANDLRCEWLFREAAARIVGAPQGTFYERLVDRCMRKSLSTFLEKQRGIFRREVRDLVKHLLLPNADAGHGCRHAKGAIGFLAISFFRDVIIKRTDEDFESKLTFEDPDAPETSIENDYEGFFRGLVTGTWYTDSELYHFFTSLKAQGWLSPETKEALLDTFKAITEDAKETVAKYRRDDTRNELVEGYLGYIHFEDNELPWYDKSKNSKRSADRGSPEDDIDMENPT